VQHHSDFPIRYNGPADCPRYTTDIIARKIEVEPDEIDLFFYQDGIHEIADGDLSRTNYSSVGVRNKQKHL
jgi:hypothetical protein